MPPHELTRPSWYIPPDATLEEQLAIRAHRLRELEIIPATASASTNTRQRGVSRERRPQTRTGTRTAGRATRRDGPPRLGDDDPSPRLRLVRLARPGRGASA